jgi:hypothetical protein
MSLYACRLFSCQNPAPAQKINTGYLWLGDKIHLLAITVEEIFTEVDEL